MKLAGALPAPPGLSRFALHDAGAISPWLRRALGPEGAVAIERSGKANWHIGALLGVDRNHRDDPLINCPAEDVEAVRLVDTLCSEWGSPLWSAAFCLRERNLEGAAGAAKVGLDAIRDAAAAGDRVDASVAATVALKAMAEALGVDLAAVAPADLGQWRDGEEDGEITDVKDFYRGHVSLCGVRVLLDGGSTVSYDHAHSHDAHTGRRMRVTLVGRTDGHPGYARSVTRIETLEALERLRRYVDPVPVTPDEAVDADGTQLLAGDRVEILTDCLETSRGNRGTVIEILGDMAIVNFDGVEAPVPCYGHALRSEAAAKAA